MTQILRVDRPRPDAPELRRAAEVLRRGGLVAFPTETVYGLGCNALDEAAVRRVFEAKGRPAHDPLIVHVGRGWSLERVATVEAGESVRALTGAFWPGPLTVVVPRAPALPGAVTAGLSTVAVRCPAHDVAQALLEAAGVPIAAPSANRFSYVSPTSARHVFDDLGGRIDLILDGGTTHHGIESTVVRLDGARLHVLRLGAVTVDALRDAVGGAYEIVEPPAGGARGSGSPGMETKHYSPRSPALAVRAPLVEGRAGEGLADVPGHEVVYLGYEDRRPELPGSWRFVPLGASDDLVEVARRLYENLRAWDSASTDRVLLVELTMADGLGAAIDDRITRAASGVVVATRAELSEALGDVVRPPG